MDKKTFCLFVAEISISFATFDECVHASVGGWNAIYRIVEKYRIPAVMEKLKSSDYDLCTLETLLNAICEVVEITP